MTLAVIQTIRGLIKSKRAQKPELTFISNSLTYKPVEVFNLNTFGFTRIL